VVDEQPGLGRRTRRRRATATGVVLVLADSRCARANSPRIPAQRRSSSPSTRPSKAKSVLATMARAAAVLAACPGTIVLSDPSANGGAAPAAPARDPRLSQLDPATILLLREPPVGPRAPCSAIWGTSNSVWTNLYAGYRIAATWLRATASRLRTTRGHVAADLRAADVSVLPHQRLCIPACSTLVRGGKIVLMRRLGRERRHCN
jgi:hypothetical protein